MEGFRNRRLRIVEFNVENLFIRLDHYLGQDLAFVTEKEWQKFSASIYRNKPLNSVRKIASAVRDMDPDILMLCEVGGRESLENFNRYFLDDVYIAHLIEGNSDRGIDLGYLVKRDLPFTYELISHRNRPIDFLYPHEKLSQETGYDHLRSARITSHRFSRDVLELRIYEDPNDVPALVLMLVHLKSQLDRDRIDPGGRDRRQAELEKLVEIYQEIRERFEYRTPVMIGGDFNGVAARTNTDPEFEAIYQKTDLLDCLEIAGVPVEDRFTFQQLHRTRTGINRQLDYIFVPSELARRVNREETWAYRFKDESGRTHAIPRTLNEKFLLPSDHYPIILTLDPADGASQGTRSRVDTQGAHRS